jgi:ComF family protein
MEEVDAWLRRARYRVGAWFWPPHCALCGRSGQAPGVDLCPSCEADLPSNEYCCERCAEPFQHSISGANLLCGACLRRAPRFDGSVIPFRYAYPMDHMIRRFKYGRAIALGRVLGELFARRLSSGPPAARPQLLIPVPLAQSRFVERGYNQAIVLAEHIHRCSGLPFSTDMLVRTRNTREQAGLTQRERRVNIRRAFDLTRKPAVTHVAIVDDVVTTGSTVNEIARVLKRAGVQRVDVWAIARAAR